MFPHVVGLAGCLLTDLSSSYDLAASAVSDSGANLFVHGTALEHCHWFEFFAQLFQSAMRWSLTGSSSTPFTWIINCIPILLPKTLPKAVLLPEQKRYLGAGPQCCFYFFEVVRKWTSWIVNRVPIVTTEWRLDMFVKVRWGWGPFADFWISLLFYFYGCHKASRRYSRRPGRSLPRWILALISLATSGTNVGLWQLLAARPTLKASGRNSQTPGRSDLQLRKLCDHGGRARYKMRPFHTSRSHSSRMLGQMSEKGWKETIFCLVTFLALGARSYKLQMQAGAGTFMGVSDSGICA